MGGSKEHPRQMIAFPINLSERASHSVPTLKKSVLSAHIHKGSLMASRGTRGPSPQTETFHRPTGRAEPSREENIKTERDTVRKRDGEGESGCLHHEWNRNNAPLGSISAPLHAMDVSLVFKWGNNSKPPAYCGVDIGVFLQNIHYFLHIQLTPMLEWTTFKSSQQKIWLQQKKDILCSMMPYNFEPNEWFTALSVLSHLSKMFTIKEQWRDL